MFPSENIEVISDTCSPKYVVSEEQTQLNIFIRGY